MDDTWGFVSIYVSWKRGLGGGGFYSCCGGWEMTTPGPLKTDAEYKLASQNC